MINKPNRNLWIDYLRLAITVLVVAHHSALAYTTWANFDKVAYIRSTHAVVDTKRWIGLDVFVNFNDVFFMSLMFLISGLFLINSVNKKGTINFIKDRVYRLLIPFLFLGTLLMLIAYFPSYYLAHHSTNIVAYLKDFFIVEQWPVGPPWFIWVLFAFNFIFVITYSFFQKSSKYFDNFFSYINDKPFLFWVFLFVFTWILYVPIAYNIGAGTWTGFYPFDFQLSRILFYFGYFIFGVFIGNKNFNTSIFSDTKLLVKNWKLWILIALVLFTALTIFPKYLAQMVNNKTLNQFTFWMIYYSIYVASCTLNCLAFITTFRAKIQIEKWWWNSLSKNAYLIYLTHFVFVTWIQLLLLDFDIPALFKFIITFILSLTLSWCTSLLLRRFRLINKYI